MPKPRGGEGAFEAAWRRVSGPGPGQYATAMDEARSRARAKLWWNLALDAAKAQMRGKLGRCPHCDEIVNLDGAARSLDSLRAKASP